MEEQFQTLFDKMKLEMEKQTNSITSTLLDKMEEKLLPLLEENKKLKEKVETLEKKIENIEREKRKNNILVFRLEENEKSVMDLFVMAKRNFKNDLNIEIEINDISKIHRIGKKDDTKVRPILISFVNNWKKNEILKNKRHLKYTYVTEDFPKEILEKRRLLQPKLREEREKGKIAYIKYDKIIIKENTNKEKRKREQSISPENNIQSKKSTNISSNKIKTNRKNAFDLLRARSNSFSSCTTFQN